MSNRSPLSPLTLTVNNRLARWLSLEHDEQKKKTGQNAWQSPNILSLSTWLRNVWTESWPSKYLLSQLQCEKIWEQIISSDSAHLDLLHIQGVASKASQAFSLIHEYRLPRNPKLYDLTDEAKTFLSWALKYERHISSLGALDPCMLMDSVKSSMQDRTITIPLELRIMGFEEQSPQFKDFIGFLLEKGTRVDILSPVPTTEILENNLNYESIHVRECENRKGEAEACSRWVRSIFKPGKRIGIVVPELEKYHTLLKRELTAELVPESIFNLNEQVFNISLAPPLSQEPMIKVALDFLSLKTSTIPVTTLLSFIQSPFMGFNFPPTQEVSNLESKLRRQRILSISLNQFSSNYGNIPQVDQLVEKLNIWTRNNKRVLLGEWAEKLSDLLKTTGWPGKLKGSADESLVLSKRYQAFEAWKSCLNQLCSLNQIIGPVNRLEAICHLINIVKSTPFQTKTPEHSIQVIGLLESSGMQFDHLWVMGCNSETLPTHPEPNPFIPYEIRNKFSIPRSNPQRELKFAEQSLSRLLISAPEINFSYALHEGEMDMKISPLLQGFTKINEVAYPSNRIKDQVLCLNNLEDLTESTSLPVTDSEKTLYATQGIKSGYSLLKNQVDCPFMSFARHRLNSEHYQFPEIDFDNLDRGNVIHKALELFWMRTANLKTLLKHSDNSLKEQLDRNVQEAIRICSKRTLGQTQFNKLERERNVRVIHDWLLFIELKRPDFEVLHNEESIEINLAGIKLMLRIDRIDEIPGKGLLLIDYKTGIDAKTTDWFGEKIRGPQLPLYAIAKPVAGLAYGHLVIGKPEFKGTINKEFSLGNFKNQDFTKVSEYSSWDELLSYWKINLNAVANEFMQGNNHVSPINKGEPCRHCKLNTLCRFQKL